jgi:tRNA dimethylallyltransferase
MTSQGFVEEVHRLSQQYGWDVAAMQAPGYRAFRKFIEGRVSIEEAKALFARNDYALAKRQRTWFRRNKSIHWLSNRDNIAESVELVTTLLNN